MRSPAALPLLALAACLGPGAAERVEVELARPVVYVPIHLDNGVPLVEVRVEDSGPFWFKIDTGAAPCVFSERMTARARLPAWRVNGRLQGADGESRPVGRLAEAASLGLGDSVRFGRLTAWVLPEEDLDARGMVHAVDGILGFAALQEVVAMLDYQQRRLVLRDQGLGEPDGKEVLPMVMVRGTPHVRADLGGRSFQWLIDTGNDQGPTLPPEAAEELPLTAPPVSGPLLAMVSGTTRARLARVDGALRLGAHEVPGPIVSILPGAQPMLGADALRHFKITLDARRGRVRFERAGGGPITIRSRLSDGLGLRRTREGWEVVDVVPGSPAAAAGIEVGERVRSVETVGDGSYRVEVGQHGVYRMVPLRAEVLVQ